MPDATRRRRRRPAADQETAGSTTKRDTVTLQWVAVGLAVVGLIAAAAYFSGGSSGGGHGAPAQHDVMTPPSLASQLRW